MSKVWIFTKKGAELNNKGIDISNILPTVNNWNILQNTNILESNEYSNLFIIPSNTILEYTINNVENGNYTLYINMFSFSIDNKAKLKIETINKVTDNVISIDYYSYNISSNKNIEKLTNSDNIYNNCYYPNINDSNSLNNYLENEIYKIAIPISLNKNEYIKLSLYANNSELLIGKHKLIYDILNRK